MNIKTFDQLEISEIKCIKEVFKLPLFLTEDKVLLPLDENINSEDGSINYIPCKSEVTAKNVIYKLRNDLENAVSLAQSIAPDCEFFLEDYEDLKEEIARIASYPTKVFIHLNEVIEAIRHCLDFTNHWFPDSWDKEDQDSFKKELDQCYNTISEKELSVLFSEL